MKLVGGAVALRVVVCGVVAAGCGEVKSTSDASLDDGGPPGADGGLEEKTVVDIPLRGSADIDVLFLVDNSGSMGEEQASLAANFPRFIEALQASGDDLPNLHIGVVSPDLGTGPHEFQSCSGDGDGGRLQSEPQGNCSGPSGAFISDIADQQGNRVTNYSGTLEETFACIAQLGTDGCGFEQPLEAVRRALDGSNAENQGFLRENAYLAVVFLTDEDDCSVSDSDLFDPSQDSLESELGPMGSYRCFEFGVVCDPDSREEEGPRTDCRPRPDSAYMPPVSAYADFLRDLKPAGRLVIAGIAGNPSPVEVQLNQDGNPDLQPSCESAAGQADPGIRFQALLDAFPGRSVFQSICDADLSGALTTAGELIDLSTSTPCLLGPIHDVDPDREGIQPSCEVLEIRDGVESSFPECDNLAEPGNSSVLPCYLFDTDPLQCAATESQLAVEVYRGGGSAGDRLVVRCQVD